jgi:TPR repeat protein
MGNSYLHGRGVKESRSEALKYYKTGADNGDGDCQLAYGMALYGENGNHVSKADKVRLLLCL